MVPSYLARRPDGAWLLERRPDKGLLGGMLGWPGSDWGDHAKDDPPCTADWATLPAEVRPHIHTFPPDPNGEMGNVASAKTETTGDLLYLSKHQFRPTDLPTVMRKAYDLAAPCLS